MGNSGNFGASKFRGVAEILGSIKLSGFIPILYEDALNYLRTWHNKSKTNRQVRQVRQEIGDEESLAQLHKETVLRAATSLAILSSVGENVGKCSSSGVAESGDTYTTRFATKLGTGNIKTVATCV